MKVVIQRVSKAKVEVNDSVICKINQGFLILLGIESSDSQEDVNWLVSKISNLRVFSDRYIHYTMFFLCILQLEL